MSNLLMLLQKEILLNQLAIRIKKLLLMMEVNQKLMHQKKEPLIVVKPKKEKMRTGRQLWKVMLQPKMLQQKHLQKQLRFN